MVGDPESNRLKVAALNLWEASRLSFDRPLPGKPPNIPDRLSPFARSRIFILRHSLRGEGGGEGVTQYSTPFCAVIPSRNPCLRLRISVTVSALAMRRSVAPLPVNTRQETSALSSRSFMI